MIARGRYLPAASSSRASLPRLPCTHRRSLVGSRACTGVSSSPQTEATRDAASQLWNSFASAASGEWEGVNVTFDGSGKPQQLPEYYVPSAYRDWGVEVYDWQMQVSSLASLGSGGEGELKYRLRLLMPTVGCEADAIAFNDEYATAWNGEAGEQARTVSANGGYVTGSQVISADSKEPLRIELCVPTQADGKLRSRFVVQLKRSDDDKWICKKIDMHQERFEVPYQGGVDLAGCGGGMAGFGQTAKLDESKLSGIWKAVPGASVYALDGAKALTASNSAVDRYTNSSGGAILLPCEAWIRVESGCASDLEIEAGVVTGETSRSVASCHYKEGQLSWVALGTEEKA